MDPSTVTARFREMVEIHGERPALLTQDTITYRQLQSLADQFSAHIGLTDFDAAPVVGISLQKISDSIAAMLGVLQAGRAFTFIDFQTSLERKLALVGEMKIDLVLGQDEPWPGYGGLWVDAYSKAAGPPVEIVRSPTSACCIVQTSGSTGQPLGVEISHAAMRHTISNYTSMAGLGPEDRFTMLTSAAHFSAQSAIFGALLNGGCLCPFNLLQSGFIAMADYLERGKITIYQSPPTLFRAFFRQLSETRKFPNLRFIRLGGESLLVSDFELYQKFFPPHVAFVNALGISEAAGNVAFLRLDRTPTYPGPILPVGIPAKGREIILMDPTGQPADCGEIVVRSDFLATGYHRRPDLTGLKFRVSSDGKTRELWTGDVGHFTAEGWLMHDGRKDDQIKIRGQRVDLAGLEVIVRSLPGVRDAKVMTSADKNELLAFVVAAEPVKLPALAVLPRVIHVSEMPLTSNGKVDRARLLEHCHFSVSAPPRDETEHTVAKIWQSVLPATDFGVYDNFFAVGGDSLKALKICAELERHFGRKFPPFLFLDRPTIAQLGEYVTARAQKPPGWRDAFQRQKSERVVALRTGNPNLLSPLFICPGGWGHERELLVFAALLTHLPPELPVYGLKQNFLRNSAKVAGSVETMAKNFVREIRRIQPTGPYRLLGECVASIVTLELAHQLLRMGEEIERLILLDPRMPRTQMPDTGTEPEEVSAKIRAYYRTLMEAKPRAFRRQVDIISPDSSENLRRRHQAWNAFDLDQLHFIRISGNHLTYLREHGAETGRAIAELASEFSRC